jgi:hypothetical protein
MTRRGWERPREAGDTPMVRIGLAGIGFMGMIA